MHGQGAPRLGRLDVLLVRHAEPLPPWSPGWEERDDERPLTPEGRLAAEQLADELEPYVITSVYSSPHARAIETVTPTAVRRQLEVQLLPDLRERRLTLAPTADWEDHRFHMAMPMPAIYHLEHDGIGWRVMGGHGFVQAAPQN